ncbi:hypothetical protein LWI29_013792 [Acer saccharum]|uniref:Uncharacterized protein n=1 Tax=Acer saccharum TaxID=4024 RepID=A0AA39SFX3_ACESA|nr:hypothetical protein LWI29_013792 [Acer saccharum]
MAATKNTKIVNTNEEPKEPKNLLTLLTTTLGLNQNQESKTEVAGISEEENEIAGSKKQGDVVKFSDPKPITPPPLKLEVEEYDNPAARLLVYALGGFLVLRWVWARWNERKERDAKNNSSDDNNEPPPPPTADDDDYHSA